MPPLRYAVLHHCHVDEPHYDLMFETLTGSVLATWRSAAWPIEAIAPLRRLRDHRRLYLDYEGDLSDGRGTVSRIAEGNCEVEIGENAAWTIRLLTGAPAQKLIFRQCGGDQWQAEPA
jgi:hypothetical protein